MKHWILVLMLPLIWSCSSKPKDVSNEAHGEPPPVPQTSMEAKQLAAEQESSYVTEVTFAKGSADLNADAKRRLETLFKKVRNDHPIEEVKIISWADEEYPADKRKTLSDGQKEVADNRNESLKNYIKDKSSDWKIETHSMAERPSAFSQFLGASDARIKKSLESAGIPTTEQKGKGKGKVSKASKAIVMVMLKDTEKKTETK